MSKVLPRRPGKAKTSARGVKIDPSMDPPTWRRTEQNRAERAERSRTEQIGRLVENPAPVLPVVAARSIKPQPEARQAGDCPMIRRLRSHALPGYYPMPNRATARPVTPVSLVGRLPPACFSPTNPARQQTQPPNAIISIERFTSSSSYSFAVFASYQHSRLC